MAGVKLYYPGVNLVPEFCENPLGARVLGPDTVGGHVVVHGASYDPVRSETVAHCRPLTTERLAHVVLDPFGQMHLPWPLVTAGGLA